MNLGNKIRELRIDHEMRQKELAAKIHIAPNTLSQFENGKANPSYEVLLSIANCFDVSIDYLLGREDTYGNPYLPESKKNQQTISPQQIKPPESDIQLIYDALNPRQQVRLLDFAVGLLAANDLTLDDLKAK